MSAGRTPLAALLLLLACEGGPPIPARELLLAIVAETEEVEFGRAFPLRVVRVWSRELQPEAWSDEALAPLEVRLLQTTLRQDERQSEETREYLAWAFERGELRVPAPSWSARSRDGREHRTLGTPLALRVRPALEPGADPAPELPGEPLPEPRPVSARAALALAVLVLLFVLLRRRARRREAASSPATSPPDLPVDPSARALRRLAALRALEPPAADEIQAFTVEVSALLRDDLRERFALRAREMTTEELLAAPSTARALPAEPRARLAEILTRCDGVKFGRQPCDALARAWLLDAAEAFVRGAVPPEAGNGGTALASGNRGAP